MKEVETYFKENDIQLIRVRNTGVVTYYETSEGDFMLDEHVHFYKLKKGEGMRIPLLIGYGGITI